MNGLRVEKISSGSAMSRLFIRLRTSNNSMDVAQLRDFRPAVSTAILPLTNHIISSRWGNVHFSITLSNNNPKERCYGSQPPPPGSRVVCMNASYESLNVNLRLVLFTRVSEQISDPKTCVVYPGKAFYLPCDCVL
jgi:hypothetical protein